MTKSMLFLFVAISALFPGHLCAQSRVDMLVAANSTCPISGEPPQMQREVAPLLIGILGALASSGIQVAVDAAGAAIKAGGEDQVNTYTGKRADLFYTLDSKTGKLDPAAKIRCISILRSSFGNSKPGKIEGMEQGNYDALVNKFGIDDAPYFYLESGIEVDPSSTYFRLVPLYLYFGDAEGGWSNDRRDFVLNFSFKRPDEQGDKTVFASTTVSFLGIKPKTGVSFVGSGLASSDWMKLPTPDDKLSKELEQIKQGLVDEKQKDDDRNNAIKKVASLKKVYCASYDEPLKNYVDVLKQLCQEAEKAKKSIDECPVPLFLLKLRAEFEKTKDAAKGELRSASEDPSKGDYCFPKAAPAPIPAKVAGQPNAAGGVPKARGAFTLEVSVTKTKKGSAFLKAMGQVFDGAKPDIVSSLKTELVPAQRAAAKKQEKEAAMQNAANSDSLVTLAIQAKQRVVVAEEALANPAAGATAAQLEQLKVNVQVAKIGANTAYRNASLPIPYPDATTGY